MNYSLGLLLFFQLILFGAVDRIQKALEKKEYEKANELILKGLEKEPENPGISYYHALLLFDQEFSRYDIDSARIIAESAKIKFKNASKDLKEETLKDGITEEKIQKLYDQIRDRSFQNTLQNLSIENALRYQRTFPQSVYDDILSFKVDSMDFLSARIAGSKEALIDFTAKNPTSVFRPKADSILDNMRVAELMTMKDLNRYYDYLNDHPLTRHRDKIEDYILKVSTVAGKTESLDEFIAFSQTPRLQKKAADLKYYRIGKQEFSNHPLKDSLRSVSKMVDLRLFPIIERGNLGFYDSEGNQRIEPQYSDIPYDYKCQVTSDDWLYLLNEQTGLITNKNGGILIKDVDAYRTVSAEIGLIKKDENWYLYHKSGFQILDEPVSEASVFKNWIKIRQQGKWGLVSDLGFRIAQSVYDDIDTEGGFWIFEKDGLIAVYTEELILSEIEKKGLSLEFKFDEIELINNNMIIGFRDDRECLLDSTLNFLIPWGTYEIYPEKSGWYLRSEKGYRLYNPSEADIMDQHYPYLESNDGWLAIDTGGDWMLLPRAKGLQPSRGYDSIKLINDYAIVTLKDERKEMLFSSGKKKELKEEFVSTFSTQRNFLKLKDKDLTIIFDEYGNEVVKNEFEKTSFLNDTLIKVQIKGKQGLLNTKGEWVLNPIFDSIDEKEGLALVLLEGQIGCYDLTINALIPPEYESRLVRIRNNYLAKKDGKLGLIDLSETPILSFTYDEITSWNDTSYLVKKGNLYQLINSKEEILFPDIENIKFLVKNDQHQIYQFIKDGRYGLLSTEFGELLLPEFTDIFNIGDDNEPLFFADQHLDKAGFHVVSYINQKGVLILSRAYTREEFDKILCDD
ncbi:WG repeat-containing protein [Ekhidna sp.]|uniref:WG repeat-containing protein n=1 Tax=Ekhidna sp. TaxID=2608089 RepID=UPI0032984D1E